MIVNPHEMGGRPLHLSADSFPGYQPIEDYAIIGDLHTAALVGKNGSIDWWCLPHFDSPSVFGALLDAHKGGFFRIAPPEIPASHCRQIYVPESNILITRFLTPDGIGEMTDFMLVKPTEQGEHQSTLIRSVKVIRGSLSFEVACRPAFNYARDPHSLLLTQEGAIFASHTLSLSLAASVPLQADGQGGVYAEYTLHAGQSARFLLQNIQGEGLQPFHLTDAFYYDSLQQTLRYWRRWLAQCRYQGRWREMVQRSVLALKLLTYAPTGAIIAAATTSLPETFGGTRNWDYRYTWMRDASYTLYSFLTLGLTQEAEAFMGWLDARCHEQEEVSFLSPLQPIYSIEGKHEIPEIMLDHLEGYRKSQPVRIGNAAFKQLQLDIYGELLDAVYLYNRYSPISYDLWAHLRRQLEWLRTHWQEPDAGIWEGRGTARPFVHSRLMSWVAFDRALRMARQRGFPAPLSEWEAHSSQIYEQIIHQGWSERQQSFVQYYGSEAVDASALLMIPTKFAGSTDPYMLRTLARIQSELSYDSLVYRYHPQQAAEDGIGSKEGTFNACSFWLAESLARVGRIEEARLLLEKMLSYSNHVGLYAEEIGTTGEALGNFPQAFTHLSLITACYHVDRALNEQKGAELQMAI
ncbi:MAG TPA: glycoside hydrolase family 15 protein [Ktedonobacteraceae bacterium]|nr:glycoside hydrolase family 15 protein [Ktedonobacteraceae bacterium]